MSLHDSAIAILRRFGRNDYLRDLAQRALTAETVGEGLHAVRVESGLETPEVLARRGLSKGRLSQLERPDLNPQLSTITQQADALEYDVTIVFTPRHKDRRAVRVAVKPASNH